MSKIKLKCGHTGATIRWLASDGHGVLKPGEVADVSVKDDYLSGGKLNEEALERLERQGVNVLDSKKAAEKKAGPEG